MYNESKSHSSYHLKAGVVLVLALIVLGAAFLVITKSPHADKPNNSGSLRDPLAQSNNNQTPASVPLRPEKFSDKEWSDYLLWSRGYPNDVPLARAVNDFNKRARHDEVGKSQSPLRVEEVLAAIRDWSRQEEPIDQAAFEEFQTISKTGLMPKGSFLNFGKGADGRNGYDTDAWSIYLYIYLDKYPGDQVGVPGFARLIRMQYLSSRKSKLEVP